jgi:hypothetical protein
MNVYGLVLYAHSYLRWLVLLLLVLVMVRAFVGAANGNAWGERDERLHAISVAMVDLQFTLGFLLYAFLSPWVRTFFADVGAGMKDSVLRFYGLEHIVAMLVAVALIHIGRVRSKRAGTSKLRQRRVAVSTLIALLIMLATIPWPGMRYGRQLLRGVGQTHHGLEAHG